MQTFPRLSTSQVLSALALSLCTAIVPPIADALPLISEIFYDAVGSDNGYSFVEISGAPGALLDGLTLEGINGFNGAVGPVVTLTGTIPADGLFVVADLTAAGISFVPEADLFVNFDFQNGPDSVELRDGASVLDAVGYGVFAVGEIFAGEGGAAADAPAGSSLARLFADIDTDDNATDFEVLAAPTPGAAVFFDVPEPGVVVQQFCCLLGIAWLSHRNRRRDRAAVREGSDRAGWS